MAPSAATDCTNRIPRDVTDCTNRIPRDVTDCANRIPRDVAHRSDAAAARLQDGPQAPRNWLTDLAAHPAQHVPAHAEVDVGYRDARGRLDTAEDATQIPDSSRDVRQRRAHVAKVGTRECAKHHDTRGAPTAYLAIFIAPPFFLAASTSADFFGSTSKAQSLVCGHGTPVLQRESGDIRLGGFVVCEPRVRREHVDALLDENLVQRDVQDVVLQIRSDRYGTLPLLAARQAALDGHGGRQPPRILPATMTGAPM